MRAPSITVRTLGSITLIAPLLVLSSCHAGEPPAAPPASAASAYTDAQHGFAIAMPSDMQLRHDFQRSYFGDDSWKAYADPDSHGTPVMALVLSGSNEITAAELRIGIGTDPEAVAHCGEVPDTGQAPDTATLAGVSFTHFHAADAAMSHYQDVDSYRTVHADRCYAIDLMLVGTRPEVYDPPATPPFTQAAARQRLRQVLDGFRFLP